MGYARTSVTRDDTALVHSQPSNAGTWGKLRLTARLSSGHLAARSIARRRRQRRSRKSSRMISRSKSSAEDMFEIRIENTVRED